MIFFLFQIRQAILDPSKMGNNLKVAECHEELAYALYCKNYTNYTIFVEVLIHCKDSYIIRNKLSIPDNHFLMTRTLTILALIIEEMFVDASTVQHNDSFDMFVRWSKNVFPSFWFIKNKMLYDKETALKWCETIHDNALKTYLKAFGSEHFLVGKSYSNLGRLYQTMKLSKASVHAHTKSIQIYRNIFGKNHYMTATVYGLLASVLTYNLKYKDVETENKAEKLYLKAIAIFKAYFGENCLYLEYYYRGLIKLYKKRNWFGYLHYSNILTQWQMLKNDENYEKKEGEDSEEIDIEKLITKIIQVSPEFFFVHNDIIIY